MRLRSIRLALLGLAFLAVAPASANVISSDGYSYVRKKLDLIPGKVTLLRMPCPGHTHVLSGGVGEAGAFGDVRVSHSFSYDGKDADKAPDDGWAVQLSDAAGTKAKGTAICAPIPVHYIQKTETIAANSAAPEGDFDIHCPSPYQRVPAGGTRGSFKVRETRSLPRDDVSPGGTAYWRGEVFNDAAKDRPVTGIAVCANLNVSDAITSQSSSAGEQLNNAAHCSADDRVIGGGYYLFPGSGVVVTSSGPFAMGSADPTADSWQAAADDTTGGKIFQVEVICSGTL